MKELIPVMAFFFILPMVQAVEIGPGENITIECNGTFNETVNCTACPTCNVTCPDYGVCSINTSVFAGNTYNYTEGVCDLSIYCEKDPEYIGQVYYPGIISVQKTDNNITVDVEIKDHTGALYQKNTYPAYYKDILNIQYPINFSCPADLKTEVNYLTCAKYMNQILNISDPIVAMAIYGQTDCTEKLIECYGSIQGKETRADNYEGLYNEEKETTMQLTGQLNNCLYELNNDEGSCKNETRDSRNECRTTYMGFVPGYYGTGFWIAVIILLGIMAFTFLQGGKG